MRGQLRVALHRGRAGIRQQSIARGDRDHMINPVTGIARWLLNGHAGLLTSCGGDLEAKGPANMMPSVLLEPDLLGSWP